MDRKFDYYMNKEIKIINIKLKLIDLFFLVCIFILSFFIRISLFEIRALDWDAFFENWLRIIRENGGIRSLSMEISDYSAFYMFIVSLLSYIPVEALFLMKGFSVLFDYVASLVVFKVVFEITGSKYKSIVAMILVILSPTVILAGAAWGQCDIIYATFILLSLYYIIKDKNNLAAIMFGIAFSFKLQALFFFPVFIILWLKNKIKLRVMIWIPLVFMLSILPAIIMGRSLESILGIYVGQTVAYTTTLTLNCPNIYSIFDMNVHAEFISTAGILATICLLGFIAYFSYTNIKAWNNKILIKISLLMLSIIVYFLPHMHERYSFLIDLLIIILLMIDLRKIYMLLGYWIISTSVYVAYLFGTITIPRNILGLIWLSLICISIYDLYSRTTNNNIS